MSELTYKKIVDVEQVETLNDGTTVFINDNGAMKQVAANEFGLGTIKTVNGIEPDENGDIAVEVPELAKPDWNQNDPDAPDYVKNKTHWVETKRETVVEETTITGANGQFTVVSALRTDGKYIVNYNGTEYECVPKTDPSGELALGNLSIAKSTLENTGEPFLLTGMSSAGAITYALFADRTGTHVFAAFEVVETVHTIDPKFLPAGGVKTVNNVAPDTAGNVKIPEFKVIQFMDMSSFGGGVSCSMSAEEAFTNVTGNGSLTVYRRIWLGEDDGNPMDAYTMSVSRNDNILVINFDDGRAPIIVNATTNTIALDPDWVAPAAPLTEARVNELIAAALAANA